MSHTIDVTDLTNQDTVFRVLGEIRNHGTSYSLVQDGVEVAKVVPTENKLTGTPARTTDPNALMKKRLAVLDRMDILAERIAQNWSTDETAIEAITNDRNASDRRLFHGSR
jgi:hypothetical protein